MTTTKSARNTRNLAAGLTFLAPNILGFLVFTAIPLVFSLVLAFSNWDLKLHNERRALQDIAEGQPIEHIKMIGLANFIRLFQQRDVWFFLGNTLFLMMAMPFTMAGSLIAAMMLSKDLHGGSRRIWGMLIATSILIASVLLLTMAGAAQSGMLILLSGLLGSILIGGTVAGSSVYRTLFYVPSFTSGIATMILWKKLFNPQNGPINLVLARPLGHFQELVRSMSTGAVQSGLWVCLALMGILLFLTLRRLRHMWQDGEIGANSGILSIGLLMLPAVLSTWCGWLPNSTFVLFLAAVTLVALVAQSFFAAAADRTFLSKNGWEGVGSGLLFSTAVMTAQLVLIGIGIVIYSLPAKAAAGTIEPPTWLNDYYWAKPSIMLMGFWAAIGSNTMLLYLAALTNVPPELYEAADIDGATPFQKFWSVTWPQLAPTTFFNVVMGVIGGLQAGFEIAKVMTGGGPAGSTTTWAYFIYSEGFETGRLGFSSAVAWTLFLLVLLVTMFNWKFGNRYVNE